MAAPRDEDCCRRLPLLLVVVMVTASRSSPLRDPDMRPLTDLLSRMEPAHYDTTILASTSTTPGARHRRDLLTPSAPPQQVTLNITTHGRTYQLLLRRQEDLFADGAVFESTKGRLPFDIRRVYEGTLLDDPDAVVRGVATRDGLFDGHVQSGDGRLLFVEPASRYLPGSPHHSVAHTDRDVHWDRLPPCSAHDLIEEDGSSMEANSIKDVSEVHSPEWNSTEDYSTWHRRPRRWLPDLDIELPVDGDLRRGSRKRATIVTSAAVLGGVDGRKTTCMLYLQADHLFFQKYGSEEACIEVMTRHVQRVNDIYRVTDFNQDGKPDNITFMIKRIKVHTLEALKDSTYRFPMNYGVEKFLELFSEEDYDAFCLAYMFTYRDFEMGTLGLAWTGDLKNAGGVCEKNGHYRGSMKSLNTGIVTLLNYGKHVPPAVSHVTLAHEIGHNFGSPHDPDSCTPGGEDGNFIMFARATSGDKKNNNKFSPCSIRSINPVLNTKARSPKGCFTEPQRSLCGNGVVEEGEECDCGWGEDCRDSCCFPQASIPPEGAPPCRLTPGSRCSPSQGPCCTPNCQLKFGDKCRDDNGCRDASYCSGRHAHCPPSLNKPNKTVCNDEFVCFMGECTGSICLAYGLESCQCRAGPSDKKTKACELCCKQPGENQPCLSSFEWNQYPYDVPDMYSKPGTPCNDYNGYCDVFQKCREVDPSGPLATLRKFLLSEESIASFKRWIVQYWYAVLFIIISIILLMVAIAKLLGKRPAMKKLKQVTIVHSATTETVRLPAEVNHNHPTAVRPKLPLKKRLHEGSGAALRAAQKKKLGAKGKRRRKKVAAAEERKVEKKRHGKFGQHEQRGHEVQTHKEGVHQSSATVGSVPNIVVEKKIQSTGNNSIPTHVSNEVKTAEQCVAKTTSAGEKDLQQKLSTNMHLVSDDLTSRTDERPTDRRHSLQPEGRQPQGVALEQKRRSLDRLPTDGAPKAEDRLRQKPVTQDSGGETKRKSSEKLPVAFKPTRRNTLERQTEGKTSKKLQAYTESEKHVQNSLDNSGTSPPPIPARGSIPLTRVHPPKSGNPGQLIESDTKTAEVPKFGNQGKSLNRKGSDVAQADEATERRVPAVENVPIVAIIPDRQQRTAEKRKNATDRGNRKRGRHKGEVIDYSKRRQEVSSVPGTVSTHRANPVSKVENWLQQQQSVPRSKSTPADLTEKPTVGRSASGPVGKVQLRLEYGGAPFKLRLRLGKTKPGAVRRPVAVNPELVRAAEDADSNLLTVPSDLEVLLSDSEFLFSEDGA